MMNVYIGQMKYTRNTFKVSKPSDGMVQFNSSCVMKKYHIWLAENLLVNVQMDGALAR
jgi:hypothetical protein